jgi:hypothetical protein
MSERFHRIGAIDKERSLVDNSTATEFKQWRLLVRLCALHAKPTFVRRLIKKLDLADAQTNAAQQRPIHLKRPTKRICR